MREMVGSLVSTCHEILNVSLVRNRGRRVERVYVVAPPPAWMTVLPAGLMVSQGRKKDRMREKM